MICVQSANHEFILHVKDGACEIVIDDKLLGTLKEDILILAKNKKPFARYERGANNSLIGVYIQDKEVGNIYKEGIQKQPQPRAFELMRKMPREYELTFLSMAFYELIKRITDKV